MEYNVGDKVRLVEFKGTNYYDEYSNKEATIIKVIYGILDKCYKLDLDEGFYNWYDGDIKELISTKTNQFTKSDLKTGMIVVLRNKTIGMILKDSANGDIISGEHWGSLDCYDEYLKLESEDADYRKYDIMQVYQPKSNMSYILSGKLTVLNNYNYKLLYERDEEYTIYEVSLDSKSNKTYNFISDEELDIGDNVLCDMGNTIPYGKVVNVETVDNIDRVNKCWRDK